MAKKYNKSSIHIEAWTSTEDKIDITGFDMKSEANGDIDVIINSLAGMLSQIAEDAIEEDSHDEFLNTFIESVKLMIAQNKEE